MLTAPDSKKLLMNYLSERLTVPVVSKRPDGPDMPTAFVRVVKLGGPGRTQRVFHRASFAIDVYAETDGKAATIAAKVDALIHALPSSLVPVTHVEGGDPGEYPDPDTPQRSRRSATYILMLRLKGKD